jgi:hypothetical protein
MGKIRELYETRVRPMGPAERLQLARLILDDLVTSDGVSDEWTDHDLADVAAYSARHAGAPCQINSRQVEGELGFSHGSGPYHRDPQMPESLHHGLRRSEGPAQPQTSPPHDA